MLDPVVQLLDGVLGSTADEDDLDDSFTDKWVPDTGFILTRTQMLQSKIQPYGP